MTRSGRRLSSFLLLGSGLWILTLLRASVADLRDDLDAVPDDTLRVATERLDGLAVMGLLLTLGVWGAWRAGWIAKTWENRVGLAVGAISTGLIGALEARGDLPLEAHFRPGWAGLWLLGFPLFLEGRTAAVVAAIVLGVAAHLVGRLLALTGTTDWTAELASLATMGLVGVFAMVPRNLLSELRVQTGERWGPYERLELIGVGGMGRVHRARHRLLDREAAVKTIRWSRTRDSEQAAVERFRREACITAALASPHTVDLYDFGFDDEGDVYYVMELLEGRDLARMVDEDGPVDEHTLRRVLCQAAHSLLEAHGRGLVHRDVKPGNLFVCAESPTPGHVKVLDFGLAGPTRTESRSGTHDYVAPELFEGRPASPASDVYALGRTALWAWTGGFDVEALPEVPLADVVRAMCDGDPDNRPELPAIRTTVCTPTATAHPG